LKYDMRQIGSVGVGLLGSAVATRLLRHGFEVVGYDTRAAQLEALQPQGLRAAASVAEAAVDADVIPIPPYGMPAGRNAGASAVYCWPAFRQAKTVQTLVWWTAR
jgi:NAD(P)-dependent dehydrogenase (short-subunit alcohol dehydrogenase family)